MGMIEFQTKDKPLNIIPAAGKFSRIIWFKKHFIKRAIAQYERSLFILILEIGSLF